jgi:multiple sugar transport system ATP-binding protein
MADLIVVMNEGRIEQIGAPLTLYDRPTNQFVAGFIGSPAMNFIAGAIGEDGFRTADGLILPLDGAKARIGSPAIYGIRPEHLALDDSGLPLMVELVEPTGSETQVQGRIGGQNVTGVFRERIEAKPGDLIRVSPQRGAKHLFDARSGQRLN